MSQLTEEEFKFLHTILAKIENKDAVFLILLEAVLVKYRGVRTHTASALGIAPATLYKWLDKLPHKH